MIKNDDMILHYGLTRKDRERHYPSGDHGFIAEWKYRRDASSEAGRHVRWHGMRCDEVVQPLGRVYCSLICTVQDLLQRNHFPVRAWTLR